MRIVTKREWSLLHKTNESSYQKLPPGEYEMEFQEIDHLGKKILWLCLVGQPWGASFKSWLQWAPRRTTDTHYEDYVVHVYDNEGRLLDENGDPHGSAVA